MGEMASLRGLGLLCLILSACAAGAGDLGPDGNCQPGIAAACSCPDGSLSSRVCEPGGSSFGLCQCTFAAVGPAAAGASSGMGGAAAPSSTSTGMAGSGMPMAGAPSPAIEPANGGAGGTGGGGAAAGDNGSMTGGGGVSDEGVPASEHCAPAAQWDAIWVQFEEEVLMLTNEARAKGATCGDMGNFGPAGPLVMDAKLRCSARLHSQDMGEAGYFAHDSQNGDDPFDRMSAAGYSGRLMGENIAKGQQSPAEVVKGWMDSPGHCSNIMNDGFSDIGIGYWQGEAESQWFNGNKLWTQNFGASASGGGGSCSFGPPWC